MEIAKFFLPVLFISLTLGVASIVYAFKLIKHKATRFETVIGKAKVIRKKYEPDHTSHKKKFIGPMYLPIKQYHSEEFNVFLTYDGCEFCINDKDLFTSVNFGDYVDVQVTKAYDKRNHLMSNKIELLLTEQ